MPCRLCLEDRPLLNSHIIPEFLYRPGYDDKGRMEVLRHTTSRTRLIQKGFREPLLCSSCESLLSSRYESYFANVWYASKQLPPQVSARMFDVDGLDYSLFKLFHLSILWRSSVSTLEPFAQVRLGPHEERIRRMLLENYPGPASLYQIFGTIVLFPGSKDVLEGVISSPSSHRIEGRRVYKILFGGCLWHYIEGNRPIPLLSTVSLAENGKIRLPTADFTQIRSFREFFKDHLSAPRK